MKKLKRVIASLLCMLMLLQPVAFAASVADFLDFPNGWSKDAMTAAVENGQTQAAPVKGLSPIGRIR